MSSPVQTVVNNSNPAEYFQDVTPSDTAKFSSPCRAIYVAGAGNVAVLGVDGSTQVFESVPAGAILPIRVAGVRQTGTTATNIVALW